MQTFVLKFKDKKGEIFRVLTVDMETVQTAASLARTLENTHGIEVWRDDRQVAFVEPHLSRESV